MNEEFDYDLTPSQWETLKSVANARITAAAHEPLHD